MSISDSRLMRPGLFHTHPALDDGDFFQMIDDTGGWPLGYEFVGFEHTNTRAAGFSCSSTNTGWWTTIASADDYYLWKLSPAALQRVVDAAIDAVRLPVPKVGTFSIRGWRGIATIRKVPGEKA